jgi:signal transduction histidine kinase
VRNHLSLRAAHNQLRAQKQSLEEAAALRDDVERIMHHDLKSPLNGILVATHMLLNETGLESPEEGIELLHMIEKSGYTMLEMISRSLDLYKMEQGIYQFSAQPVDLLPVLRRVINDNGALVRTLRLSVALRHGAVEADANTVFMVPGDATLCYAMLANLVKNAMEASPQNGQITLTLERDGAGAAARIHNQGAVPEAVRAHFFDKYATAGKSGGTGLGTYSARLMAYTMGGDIHFDTSPEHGTTLTVRFPPFSGDFAGLEVT